MSRIVILGAGPLCRQPRVFKEAAALGNAGHDVTVLTVAYRRADEDMDAELLRGAPFRKVVVDLVPNRRTGDRLRRFSLRAARFAASRLVSTGLFNAHALGPAAALGRMARSLQWDLLIAHAELPMVLASRLLAEGRPVAVDIEDWHSRDLLASASVHRPMRLLKETEGRLMQRALSVTTTSRAMATALQAAYGGAMPVVIRNVFPLQSAPRLPDSAAPTSLFWFSQTVGPGRGLEEFIAAWNRSRRPSSLTLLGTVSDAYRSHLLSLTIPEKRDALLFHSAVPPNDLPGAIAGHNLGLALEPLVPDNKNLTISNKIFQYFNAGLGVLATSTAGQREASALAPGAVHFIDLAQTDTLAGQLDALLSSPDEVNSMGGSGRHAAENELCWERESHRLVAAVEGALAGRGR